MQDAIINETGNSRYLRTVAGFLQLYPTYESFAAAFIAGTLPVDFAGINPDGFAQLGTDLNKANMLTDATAALANLCPEATPDQMFAALANFQKTESEKLKTLITYGTTSLTDGTSNLPTGTIYVKYE